MLVAIRDGKCTVSGTNHYPGFGPVTTVRGCRVTVLGAPRIYGSLPIGTPRDAVQVHEQESLETAAVVGRLLHLSGVQCWGEYLNGHFLVVIDDPIAGQCTVVTDLGNAFHCFEYIDAVHGRAVFGTNIDEVAHASLQREVDLISLAEYLVQTSITYPYTAYEHVAEMPYASWITIGYQRGPLTVARGQYWQPTCRDSSDATFTELATMLQRGLVDAIGACTSGKARVALPLSGGMDSRVLAGILAHHGVRATALTMADAANEETYTAGAVARVYGFPHELWLRDREYFPRLLDDFIALEGPHVTFTRATHFGFRDRLRARAFDAVIGGYMSDTLLKLHEANVKAGTFFGRNLGPLEQFDGARFADLRGGANDRVKFHGILRGDMLNAVGARRDELFARWDELRRDGSSWEWTWMWPFMRNQHNANLTTNIFCYPAYEVFTDRAVLEVARVAPQRWKLNGRLFNRAMAPFLRPTQHIPLAVTRMRWFRPQWAYEVTVGAWHLLPRRRTFPVPTSTTQQHPPIAGQGSWPNLQTIWETSSILERLRAEYTSSQIHKKLFLTDASRAFDVRQYRCLTPQRSRYLMYTMLHYQRWERARVHVRSS